ncbi:MAG: phosphoglycerate dehydrogenase, partial [Candidatus Margulisiibacteriota bacterium]
LDLSKDCRGIVAGTENYDEGVLKELTETKVISRCGTGTDSVDIKAAGKLGISVRNTPDAPTDAVAELTVALILDCLRQVSRTDRLIRKGVWEKPMGRLLKDKTVGIIGLGRIGKKVAMLVKAFGCRVIAYDISNVGCDAGIEQVEMDRLLNEQDILTIHVPKSGAGYLIDKTAVSIMKKGSILINAARGGLVDEKALFDALSSGHISFAGLDVFENEPYKGPLLGLDNVVMTSHIGSYAVEARIGMELQSVNNLLEILE